MLFLGSWTDQETRDCEPFSFPRLDNPLKRDYYQARPDQQNVVLKFAGGYSAFDLEDTRIDSFPSGSCFYVLDSTAAGREMNFSLSFS